MTAAKTAPKKATKKTAPKAERAKKEGLREGQFRILAVLYKLAPQAGMTRAKVAEKAKLTTGWAFNHIGPTDESKRKVTEKRTGYPCLLTLKAVSTAVVQSDEGGPKERIYRITATGKNLHDKHVKAKAEAEAAKKAAKKKSK